MFCYLDWTDDSSLDMRSEVEAELLGTKAIGAEAAEIIGLGATGTWAGGGGGGGESLKKSGTAPTTWRPLTSCKNVDNIRYYLLFELSTKK